MGLWEDYDTYMVSLSGREVTLYQPMTHAHIASWTLDPQANGNVYGGFNTRRYTVVHGFCFFSLFLMASC